MTLQKRAADMSWNEVLAIGKKVNAERASELRAKAERAERAGQAERANELRAKAERAEQKA